MVVFSGDIKLTGDNQFTKDFNAVSDWFARYRELGTKEAFQDYFDAKYCLEMGLPVPVLLKETEIK